MGELAELVGVSMTTSVAELENPDAPGAEAATVSRSSSPGVAPACTWTVALSSSAWPTGSWSILQVVPLAAGQALNVGASMSRAGATLAVTSTLVLAAFVLQTQITKLAFLPAVIIDQAERDRVRTHS